MESDHTQGEMHGCIVCGKLYELYVVRNAQGGFVDCKVMSPGAKRVPNDARPLVACTDHSDSQVSAAVERAFGRTAREDDD
jgi:hypothetical protein